VLFKLAFYLQVHAQRRTCAKSVQACARAHKSAMYVRTLSVTQKLRNIHNIPLLPQARVRYANFPLSFNAVAIAILRVSLPRQVTVLPSADSTKCPCVCSDLESRNSLSNVSPLGYPILTRSQSKHLLLAAQSCPAAPQ